MHFQSKVQTPHRLEKQPTFLPVSDNILSSATAKCVHPVNTSHLAKGPLHSKLDKNNEKNIKDFIFKNSFIA